MKQYTSTWELETLFSGGSSSPDFRSYLRDLNENLARLRDAVFENRGKSCSESWVGLVNLLQEVGAQLRQASAFISCLTAQNVQDLGAETRRRGAGIQR